MKTSKTPGSGRWAAGKVDVDKCQAASFKLRRATPCRGNDDSGPPMESYTGIAVWRRLGDDTVNRWEISCDVRTLERDVQYIGS
jgi:hypothetical protein